MKKGSLMCSNIACTKQLEYVLISKNQIKKSYVAFYSKTPSRDISQIAEWTQQQKKHLQWQKNAKTQIAESNIKKKC